MTPTNPTSPLPSGRLAPGILTRSLVRSTLCETSVDLPPTVLQAIQAMQKNLAFEQDLAFEQNLTQWCADPTISQEEQEGRKTATPKIRSCYNQKGTQLHLSCCHLTSLPNLSYLTALTELYLGDNKLSSVDLQNLPALTVLDLGDNKLSSVNLQNFPALTKLYLSNNNLSSVNLQNLPALTDLYLSNNNLSSVDLQNLPALTTLYLRDNKLSSVNLQNFPALTTLNLNDNNLSSVDLQNLPALTTLNLNRNNLSSVDLQNFPALTTLNLNRNNLSSVDLQNLPALIDLDLRDNKLASFANITLPFAPNLLACLYLASNPLVRQAAGSRAITMRIPSGVIQDIAADELRQFGVEIFPRSRAITTDLKTILVRLFPEQDVSPYQNLIDHQNAPNLAKFIERMMGSWPLYDDFLRLFVIVAKDNANFREDLLKGIVSTETDCHDRPLYFFSRMSALAATYQAQKEGDSKKLVQCLFASKYLDYIDEKARKVFENEALEIALYLQIRLKERLELPLAIQGMGNHPYAAAQITQYLKQLPVRPDESRMTTPDWVDLIGTLCESLTANRQQKLDILTESPFLQNVYADDLQRQIPDLTAQKTKIEDAYTTVFDIWTGRELTDPASIKKALQYANEAFADTRKTTLSAEELQSGYATASDEDKQSMHSRLEGAKIKAINALLEGPMRKIAEELLTRTENS